MCFVLFRCAFSASVKKSSEDGGNKKHWALASCGALFVSLHSCFLHVYWCLYCLERTCTSPIFSILIVPSQPIAEVATGEALASTCSQVYRWQRQGCHTVNDPMMRIYYETPRFLKHSFLWLQGLEFHVACRCVVKAIYLSSRYYCFGTTDTGTDPTTSCCPFAGCDTFVYSIIFVVL